MMRAAWLAATACLSLLAAGALAQDAPLGAPQPDRTVRDPEFGVRARHLGLERRVTMLQWQRGASGYARVWSEDLIDSSGFDAGHRNPAAFPLNSRRWVARSVTIDGEPLDPAVLPALGVWRDFRPSFNALPANLAATFQPEGDGLGSADNPLEPQVGDLRIRWRDLELQAPDDRLFLRDGRWQLAPAPAADGVVTEAPEPASTPAATAVRWPWVVGVLLLALGAAGVWWKRRASSRPPR